MAEKERVPPGWKTIQWYIEQVQIACETERILVEAFEEKIEIAREAHLPIVYYIGKKYVEEAKESLKKCQERNAELKREIPKMIKEHEDYWKSPWAQRESPLPELKKKVEGWK